MPVSHQAVAAFPITAQANQTQARKLAVLRMAYVLGDTEDSRDLIAVDPNTGDVVTDILFLGRAYHYDPADTTSAHDGTTVLVSSEGKRYKLASGSDIVAYAVLDNTLTAPPGSPAIGDAYLVAAAATGAWTGHANKIAIYTARGWEFVTVAIGRFVYVRTGANADTYYHKDNAGTWIKGFGAQALPANAVAPSAVINKPLRYIIENQTTNTPPGSASVGVAYIVGPAPTGAWTGHARKIALCEVANTFTIYPPADGWLAYDKSLKIDVRYNSSTPGWESAAGALVAYKAVRTADTSAQTGVAGTAYTYSDTVAPTTSNAHMRDDAGLSHAARRSGAQLRLTYWGNVNDGGATNNRVYALLRDSEANAIDWVVLVDIAANLHQFVVFTVTAPDTNQHTYKAAVLRAGTTALITSMSRRGFTLEEFA